MKTLLLYAALIVMAANTIYILINLILEKKHRRELEKYIKELKENENKAVQIIQAANETKADARTGNNSDDINYIADKLHDYAHK